MSRQSKTVYFIQHGLAIDKAQNPERPLSADGISQTTAIAQHLGRIQHTGQTPLPSKIYHSGKLRSRQTAEILAAALIRPQATIHSHPHLSPNEDIQLLITTLEDDALYVGHLPQLNTLCNHLLHIETPTNTIQFKNSHILCITLNENDNQLNWFLTPDIIATQ